MLTVTDSFIEYMSTYLSGVVPIHWIRMDPNDANSNVLKMDHLNVRSLGFYEEGSAEYCLISLDLLGNNERTVLGQLQQVRDLLLERQVIAELDYSDIAYPVPTGRSVYWDGRDIRFLSVRVPSGQRYVHYNATFPLLHTRE